MGKHKRRRHRRSNVSRIERVKATPETIAKLRPWTMNELLRLGPEAGGIDPMQHESALEIVAAFHALTREVGYRPLQLERVGRGSIGLSSREDRLVSIYFAWGPIYLTRFLVRPHVIVEWLEDERIIDHGALGLIVPGLNLWSSSRDAHDRERAAERRLEEAGG